MERRHEAGFPLTSPKNQISTPPSSKKFVLLSLKIFFFVKDFLWTMDRDKNGHDGQNGQEWTAEWTMDDGQRLCPFQG